MASPKTIDVRVRKYRDEGETRLRPTQKDARRHVSNPNLAQALSRSS
jgi:transposase